MTPANWKLMTTIAGAAASLLLIPPAVADNEPVGDTFTYQGEIAHEGELGTGELENPSPPKPLTPARLESNFLSVFQSHSWEQT